MDIIDLFNELKKFDDVMELNPGLSESVLEDFQKSNGIRLPRSYCRLLTCFDGGELFIPGTVIYGLNRHHKILDVKTVNGKKNRELFSIPKTYLIIGRLNYGDYLCIDLNNEHEMIQWDHETDQEFCRWNSLEELLEETIADYVRYDGKEE